MGIAVGIVLLCVTVPEMRLNVFIISQRAATVSLRRQRGGFMVYRPSFLLNFLFRE